MVSRFHCWLDRVHGIPHDVREVALAHSHFNLSVSDARSVEKVIYQSSQPEHLPLRNPERT